MQTVHTLEEYRQWRESEAAGRRLVLVPTMGALHAGHLTLMRRARELAGQQGKVVATIFVNPIQFGQGEDLATYPRTFAADQAACDAAGVDVLYAPDNAAMYAEDRSILITESLLSRGLCGASRPGHFDGVCTVVAKLFLRTGAHAAVFGKKDYQQLAIMRRMVRDLDFPVEIHACETVREPDGLAMSSRNRYLTPEERRQAPFLRQGLLQAKLLYLSGERRAGILIATVKEALATHAPDHRVDYLEVVDRDSLQRVDMLERPGLLAAAVYWGKARLLDNLELIHGGME